MEIRKYLRLVWRWWWLLVVSGLIPMALSTYYTSQQPDLYQAKATIMVGTSLFQNANPDPWQMNLSNTLSAAYAELLRQGPVTEAVTERLGLNRTPAQLAGQITTRIYSGAQLLEIQVTDTNPEAAALIANALADELIRGAPASGGSDPEQQEFIRSQLEELQAKIDNLSAQISDLTASLSDLTSAAEIQETQGRIVALEEAKSTYQATYTNLLDSYRAESPNVLTLFDPAVVPQWSIPSKAKLVVVVSGAAGLGLALGAIFLMEYLDTSLRWEGDGVPSILELPVIGAIFQVPRKRMYSSAMALVANEPSSLTAESIRAMRASIFLIRPGHPFKTLLLTSPGNAEGKSFVLANLAVALASAGNRVIAVDADMRKPTLHEFFDRPNITGLADILGNDEDADEDFASVPLQETDFGNLYLLSAGRPPADPTALLTSPRLSALLESLMGRGNVVLVDSPSVLGPPDTTILATLVEGTILVVSVGLTKREAAQQAKDRLIGQQGVNVLGIVANRIKSRTNRHYRSFSTKSGESKSRRRARAGALLTLDEAAERLGISRGQARRWCESGQLPAVRKWLGWQVDPGKLERMIEGGG